MAQFFTGAIARLIAFLRRQSMAAKLLNPQRDISTASKTNPNRYVGSGSRLKLCLIFTASLLCSSLANAQTDQAKRLLPVLSLLLLEDSEPTMSMADASRFLTQTTFGPSYSDIVSLSNSSFESWLNRQYTLPITSMVDYTEAQGWVTNYPLILAGSANSTMLNVMLTAPDQLRQRVAYALGQIFVVSRDVSNGIHERPVFYLDYHDMLAEHAFGNYRELLERVTLNDVMGFYLTMRLNAPANTQVGPVNHPAAFFVTSPDENYAREIMQLFSIGLVELNLDGTPKLQDGKPIPSYTQDTVENLARVFTGWNYQSVNSTNFFNLGVPSDTRPMRSWNEFHDVAPKTLLNGVTLPANQTAVQDLNLALDNIFNHPNVGPFIGKLLIQHLVTSNPTPEYVARVATTFNDNGNGVRGDLKAVINAILLDPEARNGHVTLPNQFGKFKEPWIRQMALWRGMEARRKVTNRNFFSAYYDIFIDRLQQRPQWAPSVFNFYQQDFVPSMLFRDNNMVAPVAQLMDTESVINIASTLEEFIQRHHDDAGNDFATSPTAYLLNTAPWQRLIPDDLSSVDELIERLNIVFLAGSMSDEMRDVLRSVHASVDPNSSYATQSKAQMVIDLLNIVILSPQFAVQK